MRIVFLCNCLEPGQDGVGDYTRALAAECARKGAACGLVALNDRCIEEKVEREGGESGSHVLRLPARDPWDARLAAAGEFLEGFEPDWVSLQFVCYGFHPKGMIFGLTGRLRRLLGDRPLHIMFHELWLGESTGYGWKDRAVGYVQRRLMLEMLGQLKPRVVHTHAPVYRHLLAGNGIGCGELPLFGSIPVVKWSGECWIYEEMRGRGLAVEKKEGFLLAGVFGSVHPEWKPEGFLDRMVIAGCEMRRQPVLLAIGRTGAAGERILAGLSDRYRADLPCITLGEQAPERVSECFQALDFGIASSPWALIGKSSATAALLDHGVPVVVPRDDWKLRTGATPEPTPHPLLFRGDESFWTALRSGLPRSVPKPRVSEIAEKMMQELSLSEGLRQRDGAEGWLGPLAKA